MRTTKTHEGLLIDGPMCPTCRKVCGLRSLQVGVLKLWIILGELKWVSLPSAKDVGIKDMRVNSQGLGRLGNFLFLYLKGLEVMINLWHELFQVRNIFHNRHIANAIR